MESTKLIEYINDHWPLVGTVIGATGFSLLWLKKQMFDNVYATKESQETCRRELQAALDAHAEEERINAAGLRRDMNQAHAQINKQAADNHVDLKDDINKLLIAFHRQDG